MSADTKPDVHSHYTLVCPTCGEKTAGCGCTAAPQYKDHLPCRSCASKFAITHGKRAPYRRKEGER